MAEPSMTQAEIDELREVAASPIAYRGEETTAGREPQIRRTLDLLHEQVGNLQEMVRRLDSQLEPVTHPAAVDDTVRPALTDLGELVPVPREIAQRAEDVAAMTQQVRDLIARLEI